MIRFLSSVRWCDFAVYLILLSCLRDPVAQAALVAFDDFERPTSSALGTSSVGAIPWVQAGPAGSLVLANDVTASQAGAGLDIKAAKSNSRGDGADPIAVLGVNLADVEVSALMRSNLASNNNYFGGITYRRPNPSAGYASDTTAALPQPGYSVDITQAGWNGTQVANSLSLRWANNTVLAVAALPSTFFTDGIDHEVKVIAVGNNHKLFWDGTLVIDYDEIEAGRDGPGAVGFGAYYGNYYFDNFSVSTVEVPEPSASLILGMIVATISFTRYWG